MLYFCNKIIFKENSNSLLLPYVFLMTNGKMLNCKDLLYMLLLNEKYKRSKKC